MTSEELADRGGANEVATRVCKDWLLGGCGRDACRFLHEPPPPHERRGLFQFCHDFQNKGCARENCRFVHCSVEAEVKFLRNGVFPPAPAPHRPQLSVRPFNWPPPPPAAYLMPPDLGGPPDAKFMRFSSEAELGEARCPGCIASEHSTKLIHDNYNVLLKKYNELKQKVAQLTSMNEFLLEQTTSREREGAMAMTSRASAPVSLATVSVTPVVSLSELVPAAAPTGLALEASTSRAQILTQAPQLLTVSTTQPLMTNSGALIVTSTGAHQLMQASTPATLVGGGQAVVAVTPAQLVATPSPATVQQLVQHSAQLAVAQQSAQHLAAAQQSAQHLAAAQQSAQHLAVAQQSAQHLAAAQQSAQHLAAAQQSAQHLAVAQQSAQHLAAAQQSAQHLAVAQQSAQHLAAAQQSAQHLAAAQQSAQHLAAAQQSAQHLAVAQQSAQHLAAAQQSAQHLAAAQQSAQHLAAAQPQHLSGQPSTQPLVHPPTAQITMSSAPQSITQTPSHFPMISQSILPH